MFSSECNYFSQFPYLPYKSHRYKGKLDGDLLYIQKHLLPETIKAAKKAFKVGIPVVYDLDDIRKDWNSKPYDKMLRYVTAVTTDTEPKAEELRKHTDKPVYVVPAGI
ncbi:unnamed protein product, partial [marine sediment metagenome]